MHIRHSCRLHYSFGVRLFFFSLDVHAFSTSIETNVYSTFWCIDYSVSIQEVYCSRRCDHCDSVAKTAGGGEDCGKPIMYLIASVSRSREAYLGSTYSPLKDGKSVNCKKGGRDEGGSRCVCKYCSFKCLNCPIDNGFASVFRNETRAEYKELCTNIP
jgi:hypothetical protein